VESKTTHCLPAFSVTQALKQIINSSFGALCLHTMPDRNLFTRPEPKRTAFNRGDVGCADHQSRALEHVRFFFGESFHV
jgi:hypothetical protein